MLKTLVRCFFTTPSTKVLGVLRTHRAKYLILAWVNDTYFQLDNFPLLLAVSLPRPTKMG